MPTIGQPTGEWLLYQASAPITSWCTEVIMWIPEQAYIHKRLNRAGASLSSGKSEGKAYEEEAYGRI